MNFNSLTLLFVAVLSFLSVASSAKAVSCRLELTLDDKPQDTSFELRGPLPKINLIQQADYDFYVEEDPFSTITERFDLEEGSNYYFMITDFGQDGIDSGSFKLVAEFSSGEIILEEGSGEKIGSGKAFNFVVPIAPKQQQLSAQK